MAKGNFSPIPNSLEVHAVTSSATSLGSVPNAANYGEGYVRTNSIVETRDGTDPTTTKGKEWSAGDLIILRSKDELDGFKVIREDASSAATIDVEYWNKQPGMN